MYRTLGSSGIRISALSFGAMRWRSEEDCRAILQRGMDLGINYVDTSTGYVGGQSQRWVANAVRNRRDEIWVSTKSHYNKALKAVDFRQKIEERLEMLQLDHFDMVQLWGLESPETLHSALAPGGMVEGARQAQRDGLIRHGIGFTFHGSPDLFRAAIDCGEFISATVSYNLLNRAAEPLVDYAGKHGTGIIVMNPLGGGILGMAERSEFDFLRGPGGGSAYGALRFLLANPHVSAAIVGYTSVKEVEESVQALESPETLTEDCRQSLIRSIDKVERPQGNFCTGCGYCKECPQEFKPHVFMKIMRDFALYVDESKRLPQWLAVRYDGRENARKRLNRCVECGECEKKCPQGLPIVAAIRQAKSVMDAVAKKQDPA